VSPGLVAILLLLPQGGEWSVRPRAVTVGDTVWLERLVPAPQGAMGRVRPLTGDELVEPLRPPEIRPVPDGLLVRYAVAFFATGRHALPMPPLEVVHPDGAVELVLGDTALAEVLALVPDTVALPPARAARTPLGRIARQWWPPAGLAAVTLLLLGTWAYLRRRPGPIPPVEPSQPVTDDPPLLHWLAAGERRAVATLAMLRLRQRIQAAVPAATAGLALAECLEVTARARPDWPLRELADLLTALERARFAPLAADDLAELVDRGDLVVDQLTAPPSPASDAA
jgi:hypothetical protein